MTLLRFAGLALAFLSLAECSPREPARAAVAPALPTTVRVAQPTMFPEGMDYDPRTRTFLLGSLREGAVYEVTPPGDARRIVEDERLTSVVGIAFDAKRDRILVADSDLGVSLRSRAGAARSVAALGIYDRTTGKALHRVDLAALRPAASHLANAIAVDDQGTAYVTDSLAPVIYRVGVDGAASVLLDDEAAFAGPGIDLNGIAHHPGGYLLVVKKSDGALFRVPLSDPKKVSRVGLDHALVGADGVALVSPTELAIVTNETNAPAEHAIAVLESHDDWMTARVVLRRGLGSTYPTSVVVAERSLWVVHCGLNELLRAPPADAGLLRNEAVIEAVGETELLRFRLAE